jgi:hypothetical protein
MGLFDFLRGKPTIEKLAGELLAIAAREGSTDWKYVPSELTLRSESGGMLSLANIFREYSQADAPQRPALLEKYASMLVNLGREVPDLWTLAQKSIYPVLRSRHDMFTVEIDERGNGNSPMKERALLPFHGDLVIRIAYDFGSSVSQVTAEQVETWGVPIEAAYERSLQNLRALEKPRWAERAPGLWQIESGMSYEESMLLVGDVLDRLEVRGDALLLPSNRGVLLAAGSDDPVGVEHLLDAGREALLDRPWPLSAQVLRWRDRRLEPAATEGPFAHKFAALRTIDSGSFYADQKNALERWLERTGQDIFVATFRMTANDARPGAITSYCIWTEGVHSWLPRTDQIALNRDTGDGKFETIFVPWAEVEEICGARLGRLAEFPVRHEVRDFPSADEWRQLKAAAIP